MQAKTQNNITRSQNVLRPQEIPLELVAKNRLFAGFQVGDQHKYQSPGDLLIQTPPMPRSLIV
jgi:hypothetical protein